MNIVVFALVLVALFGAVAEAQVSVEGPRRRDGTTPAPQARVSMDFKEADVNYLLRIIAEVSGLNVVAGEDVRGKVTIRLLNVEWEQALDHITRINNLAYEVEGNVIRVASLAALQREREARARARRENHLPHFGDRHRFRQPQDTGIDGN